MNQLPYLLNNTVSCLEDQLFTDENIQYIIEQVECAVKDAYPHSLNIQKEEVVTMLRYAYRSYRPPISDPRTMYNGQGFSTVDAAQKLTASVIEKMAKSIFKIINEYNRDKSLTKWSTILGDFNPNGLISERYDKTLKTTNILGSDMTYNEFSTRSSSGYGSADVQVVLIDEKEEV